MKFNAIILPLLLFAFTLCNEVYAVTLTTRMEKAGLVAVNKIDTTIAVSLMYAGEDNFTGIILYDDITDAYLHPDAAKAVVRASAELHKLHPSYNLLIKDAARPMSVQRKMFDAVKGSSKANYVANPAKGGSLHNYGLAVDITIVDENGAELPMGTEVDHLGKEANIDQEERMVREGVITETERQNRLLLRRVMKTAGFKPLRSEWWHFNLVNKHEAQASYQLLDF